MHPNGRFWPSALIYQWKIVDKQFTVRDAKNTRSEIYNDTIVYLSPDNINSVL